MIWLVRLIWLVVALAVTLPVLLLMGVALGQFGPPPSFLECWLATSLVGLVLLPMRGYAEILRKFLTS